MKNFILLNYYYLSKIMHQRSAMLELKIFKVGVKVNFWANYFCSVYFLAFWGNDNHVIEEI